MNKANYRLNVPKTVYLGLLFDRSRPSRAQILPPLVLWLRKRDLLKGATTALENIKIV